MNDIETLRAKLMHERNAVTGTRRALEATPEYRAHEEALERYYEAEEAFAGYGEEIGYAGYCEGCGIPLKSSEADIRAVSADGDTALFCKEDRGCLERTAPLTEHQRENGA